MGDEPPAPGLLERSLQDGVVAPDRRRALEGCSAVLDFDHEAGQLGLGLSLTALE
ncbi:MAG: hypothetical protein M1435_03230 [Actinobacteria bacterium]|nr:hypothetical protein [Actinomycetota bacterium]